MSIATQPIADAPLGGAPGLAPPRPSRLRVVRTNITPRVVHACALDSPMTRFATALCALDAAERDDVVFNFETELATDETIDEATLEVRVLCGRDSDAVALLDGDYRIGSIVEGIWQDNEGGVVVLQRLSGVDRPVGTSYSVRCTARTSFDRELTAAGHIAVKRL
jgi:hypothetical protein